MRLLLYLALLLAVAFCHYPSCPLNWNLGVPEVIMSGSKAGYILKATYISSSFISNERQQSWFLQCRIFNVGILLLGLYMFLKKYIFIKMY